MTLYKDDIEDNSVLRRGLPVAHKIYGVPSTINSANYVMFQALERVLRLEKPEAVSIFSEQMLELHRGQGMEIYWRDRFVCPTEEEYRAMTVRKTGNCCGQLSTLDMYLGTPFVFSNSCPDLVQARVLTLTAYMCTALECVKFKFIVKCYF